MTILDVQFSFEGLHSNSFRRWTFACAFVFAAHAVTVLAAIYLVLPRETFGDAAPAVMVELAPLSVAPESYQSNVAPGPLMTEAKPEKKLEKKPDEQKELPELQQKPEAEVTLPKMAPKANNNEQLKNPAPQTTAPPKMKQKAADRAVAPTAGATEDSMWANANWRGAVIARLNQFKRFPGGANGGTAVVVFSVSASGAVTSANLAQSSGNALLDADAVALVWRANPFPAPPASVSRGNNIQLSAPIRYVR